MSRLLITEPARFVGTWHVLGNEDEALAGELTYDPEVGLRLEVIGHFGPIPPVVREGDELRAYPVILGLTRNRQISLYVCSQVNSTIVIPGSGSTTYRPVFALFGAHEADPGLCFAKRVKIAIPLLDAWLPLSGLSHEMHADATGAHFDEIVHRYKTQKAFDIDLPWGSIRVVPSVNMSGSATFSDRNARMHEWFDLIFTFNEKEEIGDILNERVGPLVDLVTLLTSLPALPTYLAVLEQVGPRHANLDAPRPELVMDILYGHPRAAEPEPTADPDRFLVESGTPGMPSFADLVKVWFGSRARYQRAMDMAFGMERTPRGTYTEVRFLTLCHAAEALHRDQRLPQEHYSRTEYKALQQKALKSLAGDPEAQAFLKEQLRYANQLTLRERLVALRNSAVGEHSKLITDTVIGRVVTARNNLTHSSTADLKRLEDSADLYYLAQCVSWLIRSVFLAEVGLDPSQVSRVLEQSHQFSWLRRKLDAISDTPAAH
jgi:hypothetical protein